MSPPPPPIVGSPTAATERLQSEDVEAVLIKHGDHRLSDGPDLDRLRYQLDRLLGHVEGVAT